jgi:oligoribonuclease NrnB/cAMP/cGMP phosphodiesterase (DHH superfamily)
MKVHCIFHYPCADGFGAAWVVNQALKDRKGGRPEFHASVYQRPPPEIYDSIVIFVDFAYKRHVMKSIALNRNIVLVLDHHKTARDDLAPDKADRIFAAPNPKDVSWETFLDTLDEDSTGGIYTIYDLERSGAGLAWDFFNPGVARPMLLNHVEDRDLWRFKLPYTREIQANLFSFPYNFSVWSDLVREFEASAPYRDVFAANGEAIERKHFKDIDELARVVTRPMKFRAPWLDGPTAADLGFMVVPIANLPYTLSSDAGHMLCERNVKGHPLPNTVDSDINPLRYSHAFAGCFYDSPDGRNFSLRSREGGADVGMIAAEYGGGGHNNAAGFRVPFDQLAQFEP